MARNQSFALTTRQYKNQTKTVTRRNGWLFAKVGDVLNGVEKCQGLKKGEKVVKLGQHRVMDVRREPLGLMTDNLVYGRMECIREGFPDMTPVEFVEMYCKHNKCTPDTVITRIEFEYLKVRQ
jgi:hypothetical protein